MQTLEALGTAGHPFREALAQACGDSVRVCDLEEVALLPPQDFEERAIVVVATIQSFRVEDTDQRNVYAFSENFEPHFRGLPGHVLEALRLVPDSVVTVAEAGAEKAGRAMLARFVGQPRWSLANWLALRSPYVIVDEAHNAKTERSFEALKRLNPAMILELTATPVPKRTNVLFHVSAQQLQAENMIKMPIVLMEHTQGWQTAVLDAVQNQRLLEAEAQQEEATTGAYIRPIVLLQAQNSTDPVNVDVLRDHLLKELRIPEEQVKVATGTQRELEGIDLRARDCAVRYIITVQALREGWDCPFAYVLCSVQSIRSATAVEQLLGRVLRMPYAERRQRPALNKAYAHVTERETGMAANALADRLIDGMGFDPLDMASMIAPQLPLDLPGGGGRDDGPLFADLAQPVLPPLFVDLPAGKALPDAVADALAKGDAAVRGNGEGVRLEFRGEVPEHVAAELIAAQRGKQRETIAQQIERHNALVAGAKAPSNRGAVFAPVPRLCYRGEQGELLLLEREAVTESSECNLLAEPVSLPGLAMVEQATMWEVYLDGERLRVGRGEAAQLPLDSTSPSVGDLRDKTARAAFRQFVLDGGWEIDATGSRMFHFDPACYPVPGNQRYRGKFRFAKHFYPVVASLEDGGEEWICAVAIDTHASVKHWVRNLDSNPEAAFWLPTSFGRFYPDFVCELADGRHLVAEYKGEQIRSMPKELEKAEVGRVWAERSGGRGIFAMLYRHEHGMDVRQQLEEILRGARAPAGHQPRRG